GRAGRHPAHSLRSLYHHKAKRLRPGAGARCQDRRRARWRHRMRFLAAWNDLPHPHACLARNRGAGGNQRRRILLMSIQGSILVADDDAAIRTVLNQALSRVGHDVRVTSNASTLWRWISSGEGDLVITDVVMPDENAFDM